MSKKKSAVSALKQFQKVSQEWEQSHTPGHPPLNEEAWSVDSEYGEISFANFESAYAYANGLTLGDFNRKIIDKDKRLIEVWIAQKSQAEAAGVPC